MRSNEVKVGAVTLGGVGILAAMITFLGVFNFGNDRYAIKIDYPSVGGLMPGNVVRYAGVQVGTVRDLKVGNGVVEVIAEIDSKVSIPKEARFSLASDGILGERLVDIIPPNKPVSGFLKEADVVRGDAGGSLNEVMNQSVEVLKKIESIADAFNNVFGDPEVQRSMKEGMLTTGTMVKQMSEMAENMNKATKSLENIVAETNKGHAGENIALMLENLAKTSARVEQIMSVMENVATDPQTEADMKATLHNAREASERANKMLGVLDTAEINMDVTHSAKGSDWRSSLGVTMRPKDDAFFYVGGYDIGDSNKLDLQVGKEFNSAALRMGSIQGEFGVGLDYDLNKNLKVYTQVYDFDDAKVKVGGEVKINDSISIMGEQTDVRNGNKSNTYVGVRSYF